MPIKKNQEQKWFQRKGYLWFGGKKQLPLGLGILKEEDASRTSLLRCPLNLSQKQNLCRWWIYRGTPALSCWGHFSNSAHSRYISGNYMMCITMCLSTVWISFSKYLCPWCVPGTGEARVTLSVFFPTQPSWTLFLLPSKPPTFWLWGF